MLFLTFRELFKANRSASDVQTRAGLRLIFFDPIPWLYRLIVPIGVPAAGLKTIIGLLEGVIALVAAWTLAGLTHIFFSGRRTEFEVMYALGIGRWLPPRLPPER